MKPAPIPGGKMLGRLSSILDLIQGSMKGHAFSEKSPDLFMIPLSETAILRHLLSDDSSAPDRRGLANKDQQ